jgi:hypothetical protein
MVLLAAHTEAAAQAVQDRARILAAQAQQV